MFQRSTLQALFDVYLHLGGPVGVVDASGNGRDYASVRLPGFVPGTPDDSQGPLAFGHFQDLEPGLGGYTNATDANNLGRSDAALATLGDFTSVCLFKVPVGNGNNYLASSDSGTWSIQTAPGPVVSPYYNFFHVPRYVHYAPTTSPSAYQTLDFTDCAFAQGQLTSMAMRRQSNVVQVLLNRRWSAPQSIVYPVETTGGTTAFLGYEYSVANWRPSICEFGWVASALSNAQMEAWAEQVSGFTRS